MALDPLVSLTDVKEALGIAPANTQRDPALTDAIEDASEAIRDYVDRKFETPVSGSETRTYFYDGSGVLEIDDAQTITAVVQSGYTLQPEEYTAEPNTKPYTWLFLPQFKGSSPEMGFTRNLDTLWWKLLENPQQVQITGTWGWAAIPKTVRRAAIWTAVSFFENPRPYGSESVADVSRTYIATSDAIPRRAKEILEPYFRGR